jgi:hypothetical protein
MAVSPDSVPMESGSALTTSEPLPEAVRPSASVTVRENLKRHHVAVLVRLSHPGRQLPVDAPSVRHAAAVDDSGEHHGLRFLEHFNAFAHFKGQRLDAQRLVRESKVLYEEVKQLRVATHGDCPDALSATEKQNLEATVVHLAVHTIHSLVLPWLVFSQLAASFLRARLHRGMKVKELFAGDSCPGNLPVVIERFANGERDHDTIAHIPRGNDRGLRKLRGEVAVGRSVRDPFVGRWRAGLDAEPHGKPRDQRKHYSTADDQADRPERELLLPNRRRVYRGRVNRHGIRRCWVDCGPLGVRVNTRLCQDRLRGRTGLGEHRPGLAIQHCTTVRALDSRTQIVVGYFDRGRTVGANVYALRHGCELCRRDTKFH